MVRDFEDAERRRGPRASIAPSFVGRDRRATVERAVFADERAAGVDGDFAAGQPCVLALGASFIAAGAVLTLGNT